MNRRAAMMCAVGLGLLLIWRGGGPENRKQGRDRGDRGVDVVVRASRRNEHFSPPKVERWGRTAHKTVERAPEEIVQEKLARFGSSRRELAKALAKKHGVLMQPEIEEFFAAVESGDWVRIEATFNALNGGDSSAGYSQTRSPEVSKMWPAIIDAFGAAEQAHLLPAPALLDYGHSILDSLKPGMVYVGGTDSSRWVPALLNDTEEGDRHIVITQNGLADLTYLDYMELQFEGRLNTLTQQDSDEAFKDYVADARKRLEHDEQFPDEPKQLRPLEDVKWVDGKINVGGRTAVFDINERVLNKLLEKNPDLSFAVGESIPMKGTYADAVPLGPLMELRAGGSESFTAERATEALDYWRGTAEFALFDPDTSQSETALRNYSHDAVATGNLLSAHGFDEQAEEAYQVARQLWPGNPEIAGQLAELYARSGRMDERQSLLETFVREYPGEQKSLKEIWGIDLTSAQRE